MAGASLFVVMGRIADDHQERPENREPITRGTIMDPRYPFGWRQVLSSVVRIITIVDR